MDGGLGLCTDYWKAWLKTCVRILEAFSSQGLKLYRDWDSLAAWRTPWLRTVSCYLKSCLRYLISHLLAFYAQVWWGQWELCFTNLHKYFFLCAQGTSCCYFFVVVVFPKKLSLRSLMKTLTETELSWKILLWGLITKAVKRCETKGGEDEAVFHNEGDNHWGAVLANIFISGLDKGWIVRWQSLLMLQNCQGVAMTIGYEELQTDFMLWSDFEDKTEDEIQHW